jgi:hypothetical protein
MNVATLIYDGSRFDELLAIDRPPGAGDVFASWLVMGALFLLLCLF